MCKHHEYENVAHEWEGEPSWRVHSSSTPRLIFLNHLSNLLINQAQVVTTFSFPGMEAL